ncbi:MAG: hypothetical protein AAGD86_01195 [Pseudomonadota bacterium]
MTSSENFDPGRISSGGELVYGVRMTLPDGDPLRQVLGDDWATVRWYASATERDGALADMRSRHLFSRIGDRPTLIYDTV